jgi:hypothetical protein
VPVTRHGSDMQQSEGSFIMSIQARDKRSPSVVVSVALLTILGLLAAVVVSPPSAEAGRKASKAWRSAAKRLRTSVKSEAKADYFLALARAVAEESVADRKGAEREAREEYREERQLANEQYRARLELAVELEETDLYSVDIDPADFVAVIDNPYMPLTPGTTLTYEADTEDGKETIVVTVTDETKEILGVTCTVVRDTVELDGELVEDTFDWFAQDRDGNVWYFGEISLNYEDGQLTDVDGSWQAGVDGAQPGIVMLADPEVEDLYRQEFYLGEAEDFGEVLDQGETVTVPFGTYNNCLRTADGSPIEPDADENKLYAPGVGVVLEIDLESGERVELVNVTVN